LLPVREIGTERRRSARYGTECPEKVPNDVRQAFGTTRDPPENEAAAPTDIGSGGKEIRKAGSRSEDGIYRADHEAATVLPIIATHVGLTPYDAARAIREAGG
jgi:hypothetical protein